MDPWHGPMASCGYAMAAVAHVIDACDCSKHCITITIIIRIKSSVARSLVMLGKMRLCHAAMRLCHAAMPLCGGYTAIRLYDYAARLYAILYTSG